MRWQEVGNDTLVSLHRSLWCPQYDVNRSDDDQPTLLVPRNYSITLPACSVYYVTRLQEQNGTQSCRCRTPLLSEVAMSCDFVLILADIVAVAWCPVLLWSIISIIVIDITVVVHLSFSHKPTCPGRWPHTYMRGMFPPLAKRLLVGECWVSMNSRVWCKPARHGTRDKGMT